jgi:hypothetical protein
MTTASIKVKLTSTEYSKLEALVRQGLHGTTVSEAIERIVARDLIRKDEVEKELRIRELEARGAA